MSPGLAVRLKTLEMCLIYSHKPATLIIPGSDSIMVLNKLPFALGFKV